MSECIVQNVVCEKKNFLVFYFNFCIIGPYKYNLKFYFLQIAYSDLVFLMEFYVV